MLRTQRKKLEFEALESRDVPSFPSGDVWEPPLSEGSGLVEMTEAPVEPLLIEDAGNLAEPGDPWMPPEEDPDLLNAMVGDPGMPPPEDDPGILDPTLSPADPGATSIQVTVTALGTAVDGKISHVTVQGLTAANLQPGNSYQIVLAATTYTVNLVSPNADGTHQLSIFEGVAENEVMVGTMGTLVIGNGTPTTPPTDDPIVNDPADPSLLPIIDPTLLPQP